MAAAINPQPTAVRDEAPRVIVGAGPVGIRMAQELARRSPQTRIVIYGDERWEPYNRVRLSAFLAGETAWAESGRELAIPDSPYVECRLGCRVVGIERGAKYVRDAAGRHQPYSALILATGSRAHIPEIDGARLAGVFTFRDMNDAQQLAARQVRSRVTVVIGGGLLGLEAARAMQRMHTEVWVVEHYDRLMPRQLDETASRLLQRHVEAAGIRIVLADGPRCIHGDSRVAGITLRSGREIACDTVVIATGIRPNVELALQSGLSIGRGIRVDDRLRTQDASIYAVGECAEHRGELYGLVKPGYEQAAVAAHVIGGGDARYLGSVAATRLKVLRYPVFSMGEVGAEQRPDLARTHVFEAGDAARYRKIVVRRGRLVGGLSMGDWPGLTRLQERITAQARLWPWEIWRFRRSGELWPQEEAASVAAWPAATAVCNCMGITRGQLSEAIDGGCRSVEALAACTGASTVCGSCTPLLQELVGAGVDRKPVGAHRPLALFALAALILGLGCLLLPALPYADTVDLRWRWDVLWRDGLNKQISGFTLLGLAAALSILGLRKRWPAFRRWAFDHWRLVHGGLGLLAVLVLLAHSGGRLGAQLNALLASSMLGGILSGALLGAAIAREHALDLAAGRKLRRLALWGHVVFLWPLPVLLGFHVFKTYFF